MHADLDFKPSGSVGPCHLTLDPVWERLLVIEYGRVWDGQLPQEWGTLEEDERVQYLFGPDQQRVIALLVHEPFEVDLDELDGAETLWTGPAFTVPMFGAGTLHAGEIIAAVHGRFGDDEPTMDAVYFHLAINEEDPGESIGYWKCAIECGDLKAHFGLGYTLHELGRYREAYDHLRTYTELTPHNAWAWCWLGQTCEELGEETGAVDAYRRAVQLERLGGIETDAPERLEALGAR